MKLNKEMKLDKMSLIGIWILQKINIYSDIFFRDLRQMSAIHTSQTEKKLSISI